MPILYHHPLSAGSRYVRLVLAEYGETVEFVERHPLERDEEFLIGYTGLSLERQRESSSLVASATVEFSLDGGDESSIDRLGRFDSDADWTVARRRALVLVADHDACVKVVVAGARTPRDFEPLLEERVLGDEELTAGEVAAQGEGLVGPAAEVGEHVSPHPRRHLLARHLQLGVQIRHKALAHAGDMQVRSGVHDGRHIVFLTAQTEARRVSRSSFRVLMTVALAA